MPLLLPSKICAGHLPVSFLRQQSENSFLEDCLLTPCQEDFFSLLRYCRRTKIKQTVQRFIPVDASVAARMYAENDLIQKIDDAISQNRIEVFFSPSIPQDRRLLPAPKHWCACTMPTEICCRYMILSALPKRTVAFIRSVRSYLKSMPCHPQRTACTIWASLHRSQSLCCTVFRRKTCRALYPHHGTLSD